MASTTHSFTAVAFSRTFSHKELLAFIPKAESVTRTRELHFPLFMGGEIRARSRQAGSRIGALREVHIRLADMQEVILFPFGVVVFRNVAPEVREAWIERMKTLPHVGQTTQGEDFSVREEDGAQSRVSQGALILEFLSPKWAAVVAQTMAQSTAMEHYEGIVDDLFVRTGSIVRRLRKKGKVSMQVRPFHRFIGEAVNTRNDVLSNLHLLDKPEAVWEDSSMGRVYADLRGEFDLGDRYHTLESKLQGMQETLELVLDVARVRRIEFLEIAVLGIIAIELIMSLGAHH